MRLLALVGNSIGMWPWERLLATLLSGCAEGYAGIAEVD